MPKEKRWDTDRTWVKSFNNTLYHYCIYYVLFTKQNKQNANVF